MTMMAETEFVSRSFTTMRNQRGYGNLDGGDGHLSRFGCRVRSLDGRYQATRFNEP